MPLVAPEQISSKLMLRSDNKLLDVLDTALQKLVLSVAAIKEITITVVSSAGTPNAADRLQVRYNLTTGKTAAFDVDFGAAIVGTALPAEVVLQASNIPIAAQFLEVELTVLSADGVYQVAVNGTRRGGH